MASIERIREMEAGWQRAPDVVESETEERSEKETSIRTNSFIDTSSFSFRFKPCFVTKPEAVTINEGETARFVCRVTGYPKPRVMWLLNGQTVINVSGKI